MKRASSVYSANSALVRACAESWRSFEKCSSCVRGTQEKLLVEILEQNSRSRFGADRGFSTIKGVTDFQTLIPLSTYEDYVEYIDLIAAGRKRILTDEPVILFEPTSGSAAASKLIPYTPGLRARFQKGISSWLYDLYINRPSLLSGKAYWQISPAGKIRMAGKIPCGFLEDAEYLGPVEKSLISFLLAVPGEVSRIDDMEAFRYVTLLCLLREKRLAVLSVWNPTFLSLLFRPLQEWLPSLIVDIERGTVNPPGKIDRQVTAALRRKFRGNRRRAAELRALSLPLEMEKIWPVLTLVSCWGDGNSAMYVGDIARLFPHVEIQPKGLIATEAFISFPITGYEGHALAIESHFFEFMESAAGEPEGKIRCAWELEEGSTYSLVVTNGGGLYRYRMGDLVKVAGYYGEIPLLQFLGKEDSISDLMGEKLNEAHVTEVLQDSFHRYSINPLFYMLAPERRPDGSASYILFLECSDGHIPERAKQIVETLEAGLRRNYHYDYCRSLGQLEAVSIFLIDSHLLSAAEVYLSVRRKRGQRLGDIKPAALDRISGWSKEFPGKYV